VLLLYNADAEGKALPHESFRVGFFRKKITRFTNNTEGHTTFPVYFSQQVT